MKEQSEIKKDTLRFAQSYISQDVYIILEKSYDYLSADKTLVKTWTTYSDGRILTLSENWLVDNTVEL